MIILLKIIIVGYYAGIFIGAAAGCAIVFYGAKKEDPQIVIRNIARLKKLAKGKKKFSVPAGIGWRGFALKFFYVLGYALLVLSRLLFFFVCAIIKFIFFVISEIYQEIIAGCRRKLNKKKVGHPVPATPADESSFTRKMINRR
ncbi:hypothetical protein KKB41_02515 [Patescibacteria group bacterium]|nr:hypothetical protein [Patescibacteria group bacterium]